MCKVGPLDNLLSGRRAFCPSEDKGLMLSVRLIALRQPGAPPGGVKGHSQITDQWVQKLGQAGLYRFDGSYTMGAAIVTSCGYSGDKLDPSTIDKQPKCLWSLSIIEGQPHLI